MKATLFNRVLVCMLACVVASLGFGRLSAAEVRGITVTPHVVASSMKYRRPRDPALGAARLQALYELAAQGKIKPHVSHRVPLAHFAEAMRLLTDRKAIGRVALTMR